MKTYLATLISGSSFIFNDDLLYLDDIFLQLSYQSTIKFYIFEAI